jgi:hypothetical protein
MPTLPSLSAMLAGRDSVGLSVDETRELAKCANGELVSHDIVRDGIDALLQLKSASYDTTPGEETNGLDPLEVLHPALRSCPDGLNIRAVKDESEEDDEEEEHDDDCSTCRSPSPAPIEPPRKKSRPATKKPKKVTRPGKPPGRPAATWHVRKSSTTTTTTPFDTPRSKASPRDDSDVASSDDNTPSGPAVLHFSCLQCHRAKKRCDRTHPCSRCVTRGMEDECGYPDKHDPRSVLRACMRCWQTKKKCDRKQPGCGKCDKVGVKCMYRREPDVQEVHSLWKWVKFRRLLLWHFCRLRR